MNPLKVLMLLEDAMKIATDAHADQKYAGLSYTEYHVTGVVNFVREYVDSTGVEVDRKKLAMVAALHDVIEDSHYTLDDLRDREFPEDVIEAIDLVTKKEGFDKKTDLWPYLEAIKKNELARIVKMADNLFNMRQGYFEGNFKRADFYAKQAKFLGA